RERTQPLLELIEPEIARRVPPWSEAGLVGRHRAIRYRGRGLQRQTRRFHVCLNGCRSAAGWSPVGAEASANQARSGGVAAPEAGRGFAEPGAGSGGIGGAQRPQGASTARAPGGVS